MVSSQNSFDNVHPLAESIRGKQIAFFIYTSICIILITGIIKLVSASGTARVLQQSDPLFLISYQSLFQISGGIELLIALVCLLKRQAVFQLVLIALLSNNIFIYRFGVFWVGYQMPCKCLGTLTERLHIPPLAADNAMKAVLVYLIAGSYLALFWIWRNNRSWCPRNPGIANAD